MQQRWYTNVYHKTPTINIRHRTCVGRTIEQCGQIKVFEHYFSDHRYIECIIEESVDSMQEAKEEDWNNYYNLLRSYEKQIRKAEKKLLKIWTVSIEESLGLPKDTHFQGSSKNHTVEYTPDSGVVRDSISVDIVSESNVYWTMSSFKPFKSPGPDGSFPAQLIFPNSSLKRWKYE